MSRRLGFKKFIMKVEGKEFVEPKEVTAIKNLGLTEEDFTLPRDYYEERLRVLVNKVMLVGVGGYVPDTMVDRGLTWDTHTMEDEWADFYEAEEVTERIYVVCRYWASIL